MQRPLARDRSVWAHGFGAASVSLTLVLLLLVGGMMYETVARRYAHGVQVPGAMIAIGGRSIHLDCRGRGSPTVLLESAHDVLGSLSWTRIHGPLARSTRVCTYDRAGYLWSDAQHVRRDAIMVALELRMLLNRANEKGPYLLVGHGEGGLYSLVAASIMKSDVKGVLLIDAVHPDVREIGNEESLWERIHARIRRGLGPFWATVGVTRLEGVELPPDVDEASARIANAFAPSSREAIWSEESAIEATLHEAGAARDLGDRYLTILSADPAPALMPPEREKWLAQQRDMRTWSTRSQHELVPGAHHHIQLSKPAAVIDAVESMITKLR